MTRNRRRKQAIRKAAANNDVAYTTARREQGAHARQQISWSRHGQAPAFQERVRRGQVPWADIVVDGRRVEEFWGTPLPTTLPEPGDRRGQGSGEYSTAWPGGGTLTIRAYTFVVDGQQWWRQTWKPNVTVTLTYPDGFTIAGLQLQVADYNADADQVWRTWSQWDNSAFTRLLAPELVQESPVAADPARHGEVAVAGAQRLRAALADVTSWFGPDGPEADYPGSNAAGDLFHYATMGFTSHADGADTPGEVSELLDAQDAGFDLGNREDLRWVQAACRGEWAHYHQGWWPDVVALRDQGWTIPALTVLHRQVAQIADRWRDQWYADESNLRFTPSGHRDYSSQPRAMWADGRGPFLLAEAGTVVEASRLIEAGIAAKAARHGGR